MFDINAKKQRNKQKKYYEIFLSPMHGGGVGLVGFADVHVNLII